jgi:hypothetical protein
MVDVLRLRTHGVGPRFVAAAFRDVPDLTALGWQEVQQIFDRAGGPYSYGLTPELRRSGLDAVDLVLDLEESRRAWVREYGPLPIARDARQAHAIAAIERLRPKVVIDLNMKTFDVGDLRKLRRRFPFLRATVGVANVMKRLDRAFGHDLVLTPSRPLVRELRRHRGPAAVQFHHAFDPSGRSARPFETRARGIVFSGSVRSTQYAERSAVVEALLDAGLIEAWVQEHRRPTADTAPARPVTGVRRWLREKRWLPPAGLAAVARATGRGTGALDARLQQALGLDLPASAGPGLGLQSLAERYPERCHPPLYGEAMFELLGQATGVVHHEVYGNAAALRMFETTGMGAALVTNAVEGLEELFVPGEEILTYRTVGEAVATVRALVDEPSLAQRVAASGRARTLRDHTVVARAAQLADILRERFDLR